VGHLGVAREPRSRRVIHCELRDGEFPLNNEPQVDGKAAWVFAILAVLPFCVIAVALFFGAVSQIARPCQNTVVREVVSNDGTLKAIIFRRDCVGEATLGGISVVERMSFMVRGPGNVLRFTGSDLEDVSVRWELPRTLVIRHPAARPIRIWMSSFMTRFGRVTVNEEPGPAVRSTGAGIRSF
jgi:hypothetical protein